MTKEKRMTAYEKVAAEINSWWWENLKIELKDMTGASEDPASFATKIHGITKENLKVAKKAIKQLQRLAKLIGSTALYADWGIVRIDKQVSIDDLCSIKYLDKVGHDYVEQHLHDKFKLMGLDVYLFSESEGVMYFWAPCKINLLISANSVRFIMLTGKYVKNKWEVREGDLTVRQEFQTMGSLLDAYRQASQGINPQIHLKDLEDHDEIEDVQVFEKEVREAKKELDKAKRRRKIQLAKAITERDRSYEKISTIIGK